MGFCKEHKTGKGLPFYSSWAFERDPKETAYANSEALKEYKGRYTYANEHADSTNKLVFREYGPTVGERHFVVVSNPEGLSAAEIALIVDRGNLCFGFTAHGNTIDIFTD